MLGRDDRGLCNFYELWCLGWALSLPLCEENGVDNGPGRFINIATGEVASGVRLVSGLWPSCCVTHMLLISLCIVPHAVTPPSLGTPLWKLWTRPCCLLHTVPFMLAPMLAALASVMRPGRPAKVSLSISADVGLFVKKAGACVLSNLGRKVYQQVVWTTRVE